MSGSSSPTPLSIGQFNGLASQSGAGAAAGGVSTLANAMIGNPAAAAQAGYLGAETGRAQEQTASSAQQRADLNTAQDFLSNPSKMLDPNNRQAAMAIMMKYPDVAKQMGPNIATMMQSLVASGQMPQATADAFTAGTGVAPMGSTVTGQGLDLANKTGVAQIGANATTGAAAIGAGATRYGADRNYAASTENAKLAADTTNRNTLLPTGNNTDGSTPTYVQANKASGLPAYQPTVANTLAGESGKFVPVQGANGTTTLSTQGNAAATHANIRPGTVDGLKAGIGQDATTPAPGAPSSLAGTLSGAQPSAGPVKNNIVADLSGRPASKETTPADVLATDKLINSRLKLMSPTMFQSNEPSQALLNPIRLQQAYLFTQDPQFKGDLQGSLTQAIQNVAGSKGENLDTNLHSYGSAGASQVILKPNSSMVIPNGMPGMEQYAPKGAPGAPGAAPVVPAPGVPAGQTLNPSALAASVSGGPAPAPAPAAPAAIAQPTAPVAPPSPVPPGPNVAPQGSPLAASLAGVGQGNAPAPPPTQLTQPTVPGGPPAPAPTAPPPPASPAGSPPPAALAALKEGIQTPFNNGQVWTLQDGQPTRLR